ncbi:MAG: hypothetical protein ACK4TR_08830 [Phenylobacterium sp.]|uniref:hypothetical protein n=1 Tax=Phenylobacterium sp. TaxID=1871053 RepID=UPI00391D624A
MFNPSNNRAAVFSDENVLQIGSVREKWHDDFGGTTLREDLWEVEEDTGGMTYSVSQSYLRVSMGTTPNARLSFLSKQTFTIPCDLSVVAQASQRIVDNEWFYEIVEVDEAGRPVTNPNLPGDWANRASLAFYSVATTNAARLEVVGQSVPVAATAGSTSYGSSTSLIEHCVEFRPQDTIAATHSVDSANSRGSQLRLSRSVPDPNKLYKLRLRFRNLGTAPASNTNVDIYKVLVMDVQELTAEVIGGRGHSSAAMAIPTLVTGTPTVTVAGISSASPQTYSDTSTNLGANATFTGSSRDSTTTPTRQRVAATFFSLQDSAPNGCRIEFSTDGTNWRPARVGTLAGGVPVQLEAWLTARYWRVVMVNGATAQTQVLVTSGAYFN